MHFASESVKIVVPVWGLALLLLVFALIARSTGLAITGTIVGIVGCGLLAFFRSPDRTVPNDEAAAVAPADGRVIEADALSDGRKHVAIFMSVFSVHVNRVPVSAKISSVKETPGTYFHAGSREAAHGNARVDVEGVSGFGAVGWRQVSGLLARKISCRLRPGDVVKQGDVFGLIYFGSRMDVFLPSAATLTVNIGQHVRAGESVIARLKHED